MEEGRKGKKEERKNYLSQKNDVYISYASLEIIANNMFVTIFNFPYCI